MEHAGPRDPAGWCEGGEQVVSRVGLRLYGLGTGCLLLSCVQMHHTVSMCTDVLSFALMQPQRLLRPTRPPPPKIQRSRPVSSQWFCPPS